MNSSQKGVTTAVLLASPTNSLAKFICSGFFVVLQCSPKIGSLKKNCGNRSSLHGFEFSRLGGLLIENASSCEVLLLEPIFVTFAELGFFSPPFCFLAKRGFRKGSGVILIGLVKEFVLRISYVEFLL